MKSYKKKGRKDDEIEDTCINCKTSIPYDTSTWGYCEKCDHIVEDALKERDEVQLNEIIQEKGKKDC